MKNSARICYLLMALVLCQTALAFYDGHEQLQDIATHVPPHHLDGEQGIQLPLEPDEPASQDSSHSGGPDFCQHCCHCHGAGVAGITGQPPHFPDSGSSVLRETGNFSFTSDYFSALYRPPIA